MEDESNARKNALITLSEHLGKWMADFHMKFGRLPNEVGITDQFVMGLPSSIQTKLTSGRAEGWAGHDFILEIPDLGPTKNIKTLHIQAKRVDNDGMVDFTYNYGKTAHPCPTWKEDITQLKKEKTKLEEADKIFNQTYQHESPPPEQHQAYLIREADKWQIEERISDLSYTGLLSNRHLLQPDLLHEEICGRSYNVAEGSNHYVGGGYFIYGYMRKIVYVTIGDLATAYHAVFDKATSCAGLNRLIMQNLQTTQKLRSIETILTSTQPVPQYNKWKQKSFPGAG